VLAAIGNPVVVVTPDPPMNAAALDARRRAPRIDVLKTVPNESLALRMFPKVFPSGMKTAPRVISGGRFAW
jgi:hypothetical protein